MKQLEIGDKNLFNDLFNKGLVKDFIQFQDKDKNKNIAYIFPLSQKDYKKDYNNWIGAFHGTIYQNLDSIIKYGLNIQGTKLKNGKITPKTKYEHPKIVNGIKNWENAIFASPTIYLAKNYSENKYRCVLGVKIEPNSFTNHYTEYLHIHCCSFEDHKYYEYLEDEVIYRISSAKNIIVNSIIFFNEDFICFVKESEDKLAKLKKLNDIFLDLINFSK
jgi:hypothetical protein